MRKVNRVLFAVLLAFLTLPLFPQARGDGSDFCFITVLYDNYRARPDVQTDWGFACLVTGLKKTILFDTGARYDVLLGNMKTLSVDPQKIGHLVRSHMHTDHTGGLSGFLTANHDLTAWLPSAWPESFANSIRIHGAAVGRVTEPRPVMPGAGVTGGLGNSIVEQALVLDSPAGLVIITGCAHPGIVEMVKKAKERFPKDIYLVLGGFHLLDYSEGQIKSVIAELKSLGVVRRCGATHCTGERAIALFKKAFGDDYVALGVGRVLEIPARAEAGR